jgi:hypothetical protein
MRAFMNGQEIASARLEGLIAQCLEAEKAIGSINKGSRLYQRTSEDFLRRLRIRREDLVAKHLRIQKEGADPASWGMLQGGDGECRRLFEECLALVQAAHARGQGRVADLCEIADQLLEELSALLEAKWERFTVLANEDFFRDFAQIIRLRFPSCGVWDLPVAAHEFGHFVAGRLNVDRPNGSRYLAFQQYKEDFLKQHVELGEAWTYYLEEYFADVFATYALGPAYACTCLLLRFDPLAAHAEPDLRHPSFAKRARAVLLTLGRLNGENDSRGQFDTAIEILGGSWNEASISAGQKPELAESDESIVSSLVFEFYEELKSGALAARYTGDRWKAAQGQSKRLVAASGATPIAPASNSIRDLLNAAWICRVQGKGTSDELSDRVLQWCRA